MPEPKDDKFTIAREYSPDNKQIVKALEMLLKPRPVRKRRFAKVVKCSVDKSEPAEK